MSYMGNSNREEFAYRQSLEDRKRDAKLRMQQTAKILNGEFRIGTCDEVVGKVKQKSDVKRKT